MVPPVHKNPCQGDEARRIRQGAAPNRDPPMLNRKVNNASDLLNNRFSIAIAFLGIIEITMR